MKKIYFALLISFFTNTLSVFAQSKYSYSQQPLTILGFDKNSTRVEVEQSLKDSNIEYEQYFSDGENWIADTKFNRFGGGATIVYEVEWNNMFFDKMYFLYDSKQKLSIIEMYPTIEASFVEVKKLFNEVTAQYPKRKTVSFHLGMTEDDNDLISILIKNGANENESAGLTLAEPYVYEFYFNGGQLKDYTELSEW